MNSIKPEMKQSTSDMTKPGCKPGEIDRVESQGIFPHDLLEQTIVYLFNDEAYDYS